MRRPPIPLRQIAKRDVYIADYMVNGHHLYYSVDSSGNQAGLKTVAPGEDSAPKIEQLWTDLERDDPITPSDNPVIHAGRLLCALLAVAPEFPVLG